MMHVSVLSEPVGDPAGVRAGARRMAGAAESVGVVARGLSDVNQQAVRVWESQAQRLFSLLAHGFSQVVAGPAGVASELAAALDRYANMLESCQSEVRLCQQRLNYLVASTPVGFAPDPVAVNLIVGQANQAHARASQAARELSDIVLGLIGGPSAHGQVPIAGDAQASFVSHAHSGGLASTHPVSAGFDVQAAQIQTQMNGIMGSLAGLVTTETRPGFYPSAPTIGGHNFSMGIAPGQGSGSGMSVIGGNAFFSNLGSGGTFALGTIGGQSHASAQMDLIEAESISRNKAIRYDPIIQEIIVPQLQDELSDAEARLRSSLSNNLNPNPNYDPASRDGT